ncbi:uncharacterized protein B0P05DRAFT_296215 [Gilbertella persicaria]|uniref:uncharacterized protein n=1 Tax=Gilbertella persicaria TaxID=101096 RepID=UPI00221EB3A3|nr:uncharacterized protein B0P05DRAFT_296215 [Gilbertella persicaria]KAI8091003.1 hypothetical protein B0P05DRAFT_296215 [Gilbertella persicaria]
MNLAKPNAPKDQHVAAIVLTKGVPFYGYHVGYQTFLKIYLVQPQEKQQALDILQTGAIMNTSFQPFEAHLNFELQFLMDHNLYGMDWIDIDDAHGLDNEPFGIKFRSPLPEEPKASFDISQSSSITHHSLTSMGLSAEPAVYTSKTVPSQLQSDIVARESYCELEMDITGMSILNRQDLQQRSIHTSLKREKEVEAKNRENEQVSKLVKSLESIWKDETSRRRSQGIQDPISLATQISDREPDMPWLPNMQKAFNTLLSGATFNETSESQNSSALIPEVMTAFESVEALYPEEYFTYVQAKKEVKEQEDSNEPSCQSIRLPSSSIPTTPTRLNVSPRTATTPVSSQFNVSATPTRYKAWDLPSQLDKSVLNSCIRDSSLDELAYEKQPEDNPEDEDNYFTLDDDLSDGDIIDLLKQAEEQQSVTNKRYPTQIIEYEPENTVKYQPRRLDFIAETNKIDAILQPSTRPLSQKKSLFDNIENKPFEISDTPPDPVPRLLKSHRERSRHRINQTDGVNDPKEGDKKRIQSAAEKWELEKKALKKMRLKKQEVLLKARQPPSPPPRIPQLVVQVEQKRPSVEDHPMFQKVSVVISDSRKRRKRSKSHSQPVNETTRHKPASIVSSMSTATESISKRQPKPKEDNHVSKVPHYLRNQETRPTRPKISLSKSLNSLRNKDKTIEPHEPKLVSTKELTAPQTESSITKQVENNLQHNLESQSSDQTYFIKRIDGMWSSQEEPSSLSGLQFFEVHKPCPVSPTKDKKILIGEKPSEVFLMDDEPKEMVLNNNLSNEEIPHYVDNEGSTSFSAPAYHAKDTHVYSTPPTKEFIYGLAPPVVIEENIEDKGVIYQEPFYSKASDLPRFPTVFAGKEFRLPTCDLKSLKEFKTVYTGFKDTEERRTSIRTWTPSQDSPTFQQVKQWLHTKQPPKKQRDTETQLDYPTADNSFRFKLSAAKPQDKVKRVPDYIDYFSVEIHVNTRHQLLPDPEHDPVQLVFWCLQTEDQRVPSNGYQDEYYVGVIAMNDFDISRIGLGASRRI